MAVALGRGEGERFFLPQIFGIEILCNKIAAAVLVDFFLCAWNAARPLRSENDSPARVSRSSHVLIARRWSL